MVGKCRFYDAERGFGFVGLEGGMDFFFHRSSLIGRPPERWQEVDFWLDDDPIRGGLCAVEVQVRDQESA
jgi:cold shock CspA family protein